MRHENFIVREPLLDPKQVVIGYDLTWQEADDADAQTNEYNLLALLGFVAVMHCCASSIPLLSA
ncbi:MAG: hypothetical protein NVS3B11_13510 [Collimonas sp.]